MSPKSKDGLALVFLLTWGAATLITHPIKTLRLLRGHGWYDQ